MAFPHPTVDVPGRWPAVADEIRPIADDDALAGELLAGVTDGEAVTGHVCATAFVLTPTHDRILLVRHPRLSWSNPGGHLETHETSLQAVRRELREETGLDDLELLDHVPVAVHVTDVQGDRPHRHWNIAWAFVASEDMALVEEDGAPLAWFDVDDLPDGATDLKPTWTRVAKRLRSARDRVHRTTE